MKMKLNSVIFKILLLGLLAVLVAGKDDPVLAKNKLLTYPNTFEAPTSKNYLPNSKYTAPKMSSSLMEADPNKKLKLAEFLEQFLFTQYHLTRGEAEQIFYFADSNRDDLIDQTEWTQFSTLFIFPFEACDSNGDYLLNTNELKTCLEADPRSTFVTFRRRYNDNDNKYKVMKEILSSRAGGDLDFSDYLFIRKALFGWRECHSNSEYIAKYHFKCAVAASLPHKYFTELDYDVIYETGIRTFGDRSLIENDFISYLGILHYLNIFGIVNQPLHSAFLEKSQWLKAIREDRFPNNFEEIEIEEIFDLIGASPYIKARKVTVIDFPSFCWFMNLHRIFNLYSHTRPLQMSLPEFKKMLNDPFIEKEIVLSVDHSFTRFTEAHYQEASIVLQRLRPNEKSFFYSFKQDISEATRNSTIPNSTSSCQKTTTQTNSNKFNTFPNRTNANSNRITFENKKDNKLFYSFKQDASAASNFTYNIETNTTDYYEIKANETNREVFFSTIANENKDFITKYNLYRGFQLANFWIAISGYPHESLVDSITIGNIIKNSPLLYDTVKPPISLVQRTNAIYYKSIPNELKLDILTYIALESFFYKFKLPSISSRNVITEKELKIILKDFGMENMPDTVLDTALKGRDSLRRGEYIPLAVVRQIITVHAVASELMRDSADITNNKLKLNKDPSRSFPEPARRFLSSPLV